MNRPLKTIPVVHSSLYENKSRFLLLKRQNTKSEYCYLISSLLKLQQLQPLSPEELLSSPLRNFNVVITYYNFYRVFKELLKQSCEQSIYF